MATPVTSAQWVITFRRDGFESQITYSITIANTVGEGNIKLIVKTLEKKGYVQVAYGLVVVLP